MLSQDISDEAYSQRKNANSHDKENEVYFIVLRPSEEKIDFKNVKFKSDIIPKIIHNKSIDIGNSSYLEEIVFKFKKKMKEKEKEKEKNKNKKSNNYVIQYIEGDDEYVISFSVKENYIY